MKILESSRFRGFFLFDNQLFHPLNAENVAYTRMSLI